MKPFCRTQVITLMAACAISTVWCQSADQDAVREQMDLARQKAAEMQAQISRQIKEATIGQSLEMSEKMARDAIRMVEDQIGADLGDKLAQARMQIELAQDLAPKAPMPPVEISACSAAKSGQLVQPSRVQACASLSGIS